MGLFGRALKTVAVLLLLAAVVFWFASRRGNRGNVDQEITIDRPASDIFRWLDTDDLLRRWISDLVSSSLEGSTRVLKIRRNVAGRMYVLTLRSSQFVPNERIKWDILCEGAVACRGIATLTLAPYTNYTRVTFSSHTEYFSLTDRAIEPLLTYAADRKLRDDFLRWKSLIEAQPGKK